MGAAEDNQEPVIDLTDAAMAREALLQEPEVSVDEDGELVIDLRELIPSGRSIVNAKSPSGRPPDLAPGQRLVAITGGDRWMDAEAFVYERYVEIGFTHQSSRKQVEELARWADSSIFHAVVDDDDKIVGTIRSIFGTYDELPVGQFERIDHDDQDPLCELSSVVVDPAVSSTGILEHLFRAGWASATRARSNAIVCLIDRWLVDVFRDTYALPFVPIAIPHYHMGGNVIPLTMSTARWSMAEIARNNPDYWLWNLEALEPEEIEAYDLAGLVSGDEVKGTSSDESATSAAATSSTTSSGESSSS
ncbi:MAG: hypothetical protein U0P45_04340 [Acidimicrobiales bacterium]